MSPRFGLRASTLILLALSAIGLAVSLCLAHAAPAYRAVFESFGGDLGICRVLLVSPAFGLGLSLAFAVIGVLTIVLRDRPRMRVALLILTITLLGSIAAVALSGVEPPVLIAARGW